MKVDNQSRKRRGLRAGVATLFLGCVFQLGWIPSCEGILTTVELCGTVLGNCQPGTFDLLFADIPDYDVDPTCTIPGGCGNDPFVDPFVNQGPGAGP